MPFSPSRRLHLAQALKLTLIGAFGVKLFEPFKGQQSISHPSNHLDLIGGFSQRPAGYKGNYFYEADEYSHRRAFRLRLHEKQLLEVDSTVPIHVTESHPIEPNIALALPKYSNTASLIDWQSARETHFLKLPPGLVFYGHGVFSGDGKTILASITTLNGSKHFLLLIDAETFRIDKLLPFNFGSNHDILRLSPTKFAIAAGGGPMKQPSRSFVVVFDLETHLFDAHASPLFPVLDDASFINTEHLLMVSPTKVLGSAGRTLHGAPKESALIEFDLASGSSRFVTPFSLSDLVSDFLSFDFAADGRIWISLPEKNQVAIWNPTEERFDSILSFDMPVRSIASINHLGLVLIGIKGQFLAYDAVTLKSPESLEYTWPGTQKKGHFSVHTRLV